MLARSAILVALASTVLAACKDPPAPPPASTGALSAEPTASLSAAPPPAPAAPPRSIDAALPDEAPHPLDRRAECPRESCNLPHVVPDEVRPALSDGAPLVIWEEAIGERASVVFPRDEQVEVMGVVLDGTLDLTPMEAPTARAVGGRWAGFRAPGGGVTLGGTGGKPARVALVVVAIKRGASLAAHLDQRDRPGAPPSWTWKARPRGIETFSFADRPDVAWGSGAYHARIGWEAEGAPAVLDLVTFSADAPIAEHVHEHEWEVLAAFAGEGALVEKAPGGERRVEIRPGSVATVPLGMRHAWAPSGRSKLQALQAYTPPGPEQRFKKLAGKG